MSSGAATSNGPATSRNSGGSPREDSAADTRSASSRGLARTR